MPRHAFGALLLVFLGLAWPAVRAVQASPAAPAPDSASLGPAIGAEIDAAERESYGLFPDAAGFESARILRRGSRYRIELTEKGPGGPRTRARRVSAQAFEQTRWHVAFCDLYRDLHAPPAGPDSDPAGEADLLRQLALRYASRKRYDAATVLAEDLRTAFPETDAGRWAADAAPRLRALARPRPAVIWPGTLLDQRGRTDLLVFSGYYGLWLGIAIPVALEAEEAQAYAAGLLFAPAASVLLASRATADRDITKGQATLISLAGHLGTWQGIGWSALGDADGNAAVAAGVLAGVGGIALAVPVGRVASFTEGHAAITSSALYWGGWFGAVLGVLLNHDETQENGVLRDMLIGSDVAVLASGIAGRGARLSASRMRLVNLSGVLGLAFGSGLLLLGQVGDETGGMAVMGCASAAGLALGVTLTRDYDRGRDIASTEAPTEPSVAAAGPGPKVDLPALSMLRDPGGHGRPVPAVTLRVAF